MSRKTESFVRKLLSFCHFCLPRSLFFCFRFLRKKSINPFFFQQPGSTFFPTNFSSTRSGLDSAPPCARNSETVEFDPPPKKTTSQFDETKLGGGFKYFLFSPLPGEMIQFDSYFSKGLKPPTTYGFWKFRSPLPFRL